MNEFVSDHVLLPAGVLGSAAPRPLAHVGWLRMVAINAKWLHCVRGDDGGCVAPFAGCGYLPATQTRSVITDCQHNLVDTVSSQHGLRRIHLITLTFSRSAGSVEVVAYFHIRIPDELKQRTREAADSLGIKESEFVREAVEAAIQRVELANAWLVYRVRKDKRAPWLVVTASDEKAALKKAKKEFGAAGFSLEVVRAFEAPKQDLAVVPR